MIERKEHIYTQQLKQKMLQEQIQAQREFRIEQQAEHAVRLELLRAKLAFKRKQLKVAGKKKAIQVIPVL